MNSVIKTSVFDKTVLIQPVFGTMYFNIIIESDS